MGRKLFCEICPAFYQISVAKCRLIRHMQDIFFRPKFAKEKQDKKLPVVVYSHKSLIRRKLGDVDLQLQENKAVNLSIAAPKVNGILIYPGETFSFWKLVGKTSASKGYKDGLTISSGNTKKGIGGGMCQFTNLIHWMVLHSPLLVKELHHHDQYDLFHDYGRKVPLGTGTSIMYNYLDYRFVNHTDQTFQLLVWVTDKYLCGELRCEEPLTLNRHIVCEGEHFSKEGEHVYRNGKVYRDTFDKETGNLIHRELIRNNHAKVMYDVTGLEIEEDAEG